MKLLKSFSSATKKAGLIKKKARSYTIKPYLVNMFIDATNTSKVVDKRQH